MSNVAESVVVARVGEMPSGTTKKFFLRIDGNEEECFLVSYAGKLTAYVNRCAHVPMGLDWVDNQFFTPEKDFIQCATHGAHYVPDTGECVSGPPCGKSLRRVPLRTDGDRIIAYAPDEE
jgi:nitrite reductase/ring-hydroxylating ferredoxin subunit